MIHYLHATSTSPTTHSATMLYHACVLCSGRGHSLHTAYTVHVGTRNSVWMHDEHAVLWMRAARPARSIHQHRAGVTMHVVAATIYWWMCTPWLPQAYHPAQHESIAPLCNGCTPKHPRIVHQPLLPVWWMHHAEGWIPTILHAMCSQGRCYLRSGLCCAGCWCSAYSRCYQPHTVRGAQPQDTMLPVSTPATVHG